MSSPISPSLLAYSVEANPARPPHLGTRYDEHGTFLPEHGNTVVCNLVDGSPSHAAILEVRRRMMAMPDADRLAFTPIPSLHMTLFDGANEHMRQRSRWPEGVPLDAEIDDVTETYRGRLATFHGLGSFRVGTVEMRPAGLLLGGATAADEKMMRAWRDALTAPFGFRQDNHESYRFHMTLAYPVRWLAQERLPAWAALFNDCLALLAERSPMLDLRAPALCRYKDMTFFEELVVME